MIEFISKAKKDHNVFPLYKGVEKASYNLSPVLTERVRQMALKWGLKASVNDNVLTVSTY